MLIYKICRKTEYETARKLGVFRGSPDDERDGFIHFSTSSQLPGTLEKHFACEADLILLQVASEALAPQLRWEQSRHGELFPHLYGELDMSLIDVDMEICFDGTRHQLPEGLVS